MAKEKKSKYTLVPSKSDPSVFEKLRSEALNKQGPTHRVAPEILDLAKTYYLSGCSIPQVSRLTGLPMPTIEYHIFHKKEGRWRDTKHQIDQLKNEMLSATMVKVTTDYAEVLMHAAEKLRNRIESDGVELSVQDQKTISDIIANQQKSAYAKMKLELEMLELGAKSLSSTEITMHDAEAIMASDPAAMLGDENEECLPIQSSTSGSVPETENASQNPASPVEDEDGQPAAHPESDVTPED